MIINIEINICKKCARRTHVYRAIYCKLGVGASDDDKRGERERERVRVKYLHTRVHQVVAHWMKPLNIKWHTIGTLFHVQIVIGYDIPIIFLLDIQGVQQLLKVLLRVVVKVTIIENFFTPSMYNVN